MYLRDGSRCDLLPKIENVCFPRRPPNPPPLSDCVLEKKKDDDVVGIFHLLSADNYIQLRPHRKGICYMDLKSRLSGPPHCSPLSLHVCLHTQKLINWTFSSVKSLATKTPKVQLPATQREIILKLWLTRMSFCGGKKRKKEGLMCIAGTHLNRNHSVCNGLMDFFFFFFT